MLKSISKVLGVLGLTILTTHSSLAQQLGDFGIRMDVESHIAMVEADSARNVHNQNTSQVWAVNSQETITYCSEWYYEGGQIQRVTPEADVEEQYETTDNSDSVNELGTEIPNDGAMTNRRICLIWETRPKEMFGTASVFLGDDNYLNKPVVIVQPYILSLDNSNYSAADFFADLNTGGFISSLRDGGYDVILYTYRDQNIGIEKNANGLTRLLQILDAKTTVSSSSVVGLSMGGVVARYALTQAHSQGNNFDVATYISFDAPHAGVSFPITISDSVKRLLRKVDTSLCGLSGACRKARRELEEIIVKTNTKTFKELINDNPNGNTERALLRAQLNSLGHVNNIPTPAITNGSFSTTQGAPARKLTTHFKLFRAWYNGGSEYFKVYTNPIVDNQPGGHVDFYGVYSDLISEREHPITPYVTEGQQHSFVETSSAIDGHVNNFTDVLMAPNFNERHLTLTYEKAVAIREWLDTYQY